MHPHPSDGDPDTDASGWPNDRDIGEMLRLLRSVQRYSRAIATSDQKRFARDNLAMLERIRKNAQRIEEMLRESDP